MVDEADGKLKNSDLKKLAAGIKTTQAAEIEEMRRILATLPAEKKSARPDAGLATSPATTATAASRGTTAAPVGRAQRTTMETDLAATLAAITGATGDGRRQKLLDRHRAPALGIASHVHHAESALTDQAGDLVAGQHASGR